MRRFVLILAALLAACSAPAASSPTPKPSPTLLNLSTLPAVGPTVLRSDVNLRTPTANAAQPAATPAPTATLPAPPTPAAVGFDYALREQFRQNLNTVENKSVYTMKWELNDDLSELRGSQRVIFANRTDKPLREVYLRLFANYPGETGKITVSNVMVGGTSVRTQLEAQDTALRVTLPRPLNPRQVIPIQMEYVIEIPRDSTIRYADFTRTDWITTLPSIYPLIPAYDAEGWHLEVPPPYGDLVYADSSIYDVTIVTPSQYQVVASGQLVQEVAVGGGKTARRYIGAPMRDFDANVSQSLVKNTAPVDDVTINSYAVPQDAEAGKRALQWTVDAFKIYEKRFGPYPFKELDLVESPTLAGGIEYPGLITVAANLYRDPGQTGFFEFATVHETAHQWFYSTVGNDQVNHPWLDEALVQYAALVYFQDKYGQEQAQLIWDNYFVKPYENAKQQYGDMPGGLPVGAYAENAYGAFVYDKAPRFFADARTLMGDDAFFKALQTYYRQFNYRIAQPEDLTKILSAAAGQDITPLYDKWIGK